jgi:4'-phosphopantetheinyl transferase EntD
VQVPLIYLSSIVRPAPTVSSLFPGGIVAVDTNCPISPRYLFKEEAMCIDGAVEKRRVEFAAGRVCARRALAEIGFADAPIMQSPLRDPIWPKGATGSISHTDGYCVAVVGRSNLYDGIGVDTEVIGRLELNLWRTVFRAEEIDCLSRLHGPYQAEVATAMFSAKEAFYKCQFAITRSWLGFNDVRVEVSASTFRLSLCRDGICTFLDRKTATGKFVKFEGRIISGIAIQRAGLMSGAISHFV